MAKEFTMRDYVKALEEHNEAEIGSDMEEFAERKILFIIGIMLFNPETEVKAEQEILESLDALEEFGGKGTVDHRFLTWLLDMKDSEE